MSGQLSTAASSRSRLSDTTRLRELLRLIVVVGLAIDAYVHFHLAPNFDGLKGTGSLAVSQGLLFRVEAVAAVVAAVLIVAWRHRISAIFAFMVLAGGLAAVLVYSVFDIGPIGPLPSMYDPTWYPEKTISTVAEGIAAAAALALTLLPARPRREVA